MPFCPQCGAAVQGNYCQQCGAVAGGITPAREAGQTGLSDNVAGVLCYVLGIITGVLFLVLPAYNKNPRIRFHAWQAILFHAACVAVAVALGIVLGILPGGFGVHRALSGLLWLVSLGLWILLMVKAYQGELFELPVIGPFARRQAGL